MPTWRRVYEVDALSKTEKHKVIDKRIVLFDKLEPEKSLTRKDIMQMRKDGIYDKESIGHRIEDVERVVSGGYLVYFPRGHSIFFENEDQLSQAGFSTEKDAGIVDMETGFVKGDDGLGDMSLKEMSARNTQITPRSRRSVDAVIKDGE